MTQRARKGRFRLLFKLWRLLRVASYRRGLLAGTAATVEHADIPFGDSYNSVIDVGSHHGQFALFALKRYPGARILCVEPYGPARDRLRKVVAAYPAITLYPYAASDRSARSEFHVSRKTDSSSLLAIRGTYTAAFPGTEETEVVLVESRPLDGLLSGDDLLGPILLKIDVQGGELAVLRGAREILESVQTVLVECSFVEFYAGQALIGDVVEHLNDRFRLAGVFGLVRDGGGECLQADLLFERRA